MEMGGKKKEKEEIVKRGRGERREEGERGGGGERAIIEGVGTDAATPQKEIKTQNRRPVPAHKKNGK